MPAPTRIVTGQHIAPEQLERARRLRREMTPQEKVLWECLRANRLDGRKFRRQQIVDGFLLDFYYHQAGLVIEVDGPIHEQRHGYDAARDEWLARRGLGLLRFTNAEIENNLEDVLHRIRAACDGA
jgi:very-short-patch-repair endonuclease